MLCPSCNHTLQKLPVTTTSGGKFNVDHCGRCGGTWFDPYEINRIPYHEVLRLAKLTTLSHQKPQEKSKNLCPRCIEKLAKFHPKSKPSKIDLFRCKKCHGVWSTQKALEEFKQDQDERIAKYKKEGVAFPSLSVVFLPALFTFLLVFTTFFTVRSLQKSQESRIKAHEIIKNISSFSVSNTSTSISFQTTSPVRSIISYGVSSLEKQTKTVSKFPSTNHSILLQDLQKNTTYIFKIILEDEKGSEFTTEKMSFTTKE